MIGKIIVKALLNLRNLGILTAAIIITYILRDIVPLIGGTSLIWAVPLVIYAFFVLQSLSSKEFHEKVSSTQKAKHIQELDKKCLELSYEAKKCLTSSYYTRLRKVMDDKNEIVRSYLKGEKGYLKEKIVEQTLNLVISYLKLLANFSRRSKEVANTNVTDIANRVTVNNRKLSINVDPVVAEDIKRSIEMDEKIIVRIKEEKQELERISAKLDYMESMVNMFKQQILSSIESEDMVTKLETAVNEATALDNVLDERRKNKYLL